MVLVTVKEHALMDAITVSLYITKTAILVITELLSIHLHGSHLDVVNVEDRENLKRKPNADLAKEPINVPGAMVQA